MIGSFLICNLLWNTDRLGEPTDRKQTEKDIFNFREYGKTTRNISWLINGAPVTITFLSIGLLVTQRRIRNCLAKAALPANTPQITVHHSDALQSTRTCGDFSLLVPLASAFRNFRRSSYRLSRMAMCALHPITRNGKAAKESQQTRAFPISLGDPNSPQNGLS